MAMRRRREGLNRKLGKEESMERAEGPKVSAHTLDALLGRSLNEVERKYAPKELYTAGPMEIPVPRPRVAIVGSRDATSEGLAEAGLIAKTLTKDGVVIVSGLARGIDSAAHKGAIGSGGRTIAVLGTPLDRAYPPENAPLQAEIVRDHLAVSQFRIGSVVTKSNFILRNRTMALISDASIIVQAGPTSGSLSQGYEALRLGRPLFIWKKLWESGLEWPKEMVKYGAMVLSNPKELLESLPSRGVIQIKM